MNQHNPATKITKIISGAINKISSPKGAKAAISLEVLEACQFTKNMLRISFGGEGANLIPEGSAGGYLKLQIPSEEAKNGFNRRTYTIRHQSANRLDIDFALHGGKGNDGFATSWALNAKAGDQLVATGPGPAKPLPSNEGSLLVVGDMTALPAIGVNLDLLGPNAKGHAVVVIQDESDKQDFDLPEQFQLHWLVDPEPGKNEHLLSDFVRGLSWPDDMIYAWVACEFNAMKFLRTYLRDERGLGRDELYISSYWKRGLIEDAHRVVKRSDAEENN